MSTYKPHKPTFAFDTEEVDANPIEPTLGVAPTTDVEKPDEDILERMKMDRSLLEMTLGDPLRRMRDDFRKKGINPVSTDYVRDATDKTIKAREFFETAGKTMDEEGYIDLTQPVTNIANFNKRVDQYISSGLAEEVKDASGRRVGIKMKNDSDISPMIDSAYRNIKVPEAMSDVAQSDYFSELTRNVISQLPVNDKGEIEYNGVPYHWAELYEAFYPVVADRAHETLINSNKGYYNWAFEQAMGMSYEDWYKGYAEQRVSEIEQKIIELRDAVAEETAQIAEGKGREVALSSGTLVPATLLGWASKEAARAEASKQFNDVLESINTFRDNGFLSGLNEGFDWLNVLSMGVADLGTAYSQLQLLEKAKRGEELSNSESKVLELLQLTQEFEGIKQSLGWERNLRSSVGSGLGSTLAMAPSFALGMAGTSRIGTIASLTANVAKNASKRATIKQVGKNLIHNLGTGYMRGAAASAFMPNTYTIGAKELQEQYSFNPDGTIKFEPKSKALAFMGGYIDTMNEYASEVFGSTLGEIIGYGARAFGRVTRLNKVVDAVMDPVNTGLSKAIDKGLSYIPIEDEAKLAGVRKALRGMIVPNAELDDETKEFMRMWGVQDGYVAEATSEVFGDLMSQVMRDLVGAKTDYSDFEDSTYWGTQLLVAVLYGGSMNTLAHIKEGVSDYQQLVDLGKYKKDILDKIESRELRNKVLAITADGSIEDMAKQLAEIEWKKYHATDRAKVMDYIRAEMQIQVTAGSVEENSQVEAFVKEAAKLSGVTYQGKGNKIKEVAVDGRTYYLVNGNEADKSESSMLTCIDKETGEMKAIHSSKATTTSDKYFNDVLQDVYTSHFSVSSEATRISALQSAYGQMEKPTAEVARDMMKQMGITPPAEGEVITMADGRKAKVEQDLENGSYVVRLQGEVPLLFTIPFYSIQSSNPLTAEAQKSIIEGKVGSAANKAADVSAMEVENGDVTEETMAPSTQGETSTETAEAEMQSAEVVAQTEEQIANDTLDMSNVPTDAEGNIDFDAIDDPMQYAALYEREAGSKSEAAKEVEDLKRNTLEAAAKLEEQAKNEITASAKRKKLKEANKLRERAAFYDKVLPEFEEMEEEYTSVVKNEYSQQVAEPTLRVLDAMAKKLGLKVRFVDEVRTASGNKANANINGDEVEIAFMERIKSIAFLMGHEFTHRMQDLSPEQYAEFKQMVKDFVGEEKWNALVAQTAQAYAKQNQPFTVALIEDEVTADAAGELVESNDAFLKYLEGKKDNKTFLMKVAEFLRDMVSMFNTANDRERERQYLGLLDGVNTLIESAASAEAASNGQGERFSIIGEQGASAEELAEIEAERQAIIETTKANGTYLKAPNGKDTNLTPEQWVDVRTSRFKKWFGDWELAEIAEYLMSNDVVAILNGDEFAKDGTPLTEKVSKFYEDNYKGKVERKGLGEVILDKRSVKDSTIHGFGKAKTAAFAAVPNIITEGRIIDEQKNWKGRNYDSVTIAAPVQIGESIYVGIVIVRKGQGTNTNRFYLHEVVLQERLQDESFKTDTKADSHRGDIAKVMQKIFISKENSSKIVDENGEPKVVWHGGQFGISSFIPKRNMHFGTKKAAMQRILDEHWGYDNWLIQNEDGSYSWKYEDEYDETNNVESNKTFATEEEAMADALLHFGNEVVVKPYFLNIRHLERTDDAQSSWDDAIEVVKAESDNVDGIVYENWYEDKGSDSYIAFESNQIKSATDNVGTYNANNPDIRFSLITPEMDASYLDAVGRGDMAAAQRMVMEAAEKAGYINDESWRMAHRAPRRDEENSNPFNTEIIVPEDYWEHPEWYTDIRRSSETRESYYAMKRAIDKYKRLMAEGKTDEADNVTITMYRGVDKTANKREASFRNGDWITPSRSYALLSAPYGKARVISQEVKLKDIWWDGNSINEWGYDDGANYGYRDTKNNRKLLDPVTYDDAGNVIPLSERFNPEKEDIRYSLSEETIKIFDAAKAKFGTTSDMREAGYILPDGSMLDFSGRHQVRGSDTSFLNGDRTVDHREIFDIAYDADDNETGINTDLGDFLDRGAIRIDSRAGAINLNVAPTMAQKDRLKRLIERNDGYVYIDFGKGWDTEHYAEYEAARASRVLGDIDRYFDEGIKPTGNVRFSLQEANNRFNEELATLTEENARERILNVGTPSSILLACGIENKPIRLYGAKLLSKVRKHGYNLDDLKNLPLAMSEPIAVFNGSNPNSFAILTELRVGDKNILVALSVGKGGHDVDFNIISSVYDKRGDSVARWVNDGKMLWVDKKKALDYFSVSAPLAEAQNNQELISTTNIIQNFQNPKIEPKFSLIGEIGAANLDTYGRYGSPMLALEMAREFEAEGKTAKDIRLATNWERGKDGKWRYEIMDGAYHHPEDDDITAKEYRLADILDNPDLYKAYPYLKDLKVTYNAEMTPNGRYNGKGIELKSTRTPEQINSTLIHEVQHAIQYAEMFAKGGSVKSIAKELVAEGKQLAEEFKNTPNVDVIRKGYLLYQIARKAMDSVKADVKATEAYRSLAGEVEARNVQKRMGMSEDERLETLLSATEDVARDAQRILFYEAKGGAEDARYSIIHDMTEEDAYQASLLEEAMRMEREATSNGMDIAQEIADATGWVHLADGTWKYYGEGKLEITDKSSAERAAFRWLESKKAVKVEQVRRTYAPLIKSAENNEVKTQLEYERDAALAQIEAEYKEIFDDFDNNPDTYVREHQEAESYNANLDMYVGSLTKARKEVERLERSAKKRKLSDEEKMAAMRAVKSAVAKELRDGLGRFTRKYDIQRMMDAVSDARTPYAMLKAIDKAMESLFEIKWRREYARMQMLTKSKISYGVTAIDASSFLNTFVSDHKITAADARKIMNDYWRGTKANGVSVAKYIDDTTRQAMEFISEMVDYAVAREKFSDIKATEVIAFTRKLREKLEDYTSLNDYKLKTALANETVRKAIIDAVDILEMYWKAQELQLSLNDDKHRRDTSALEIKAKEITAQLREVNQQIKDLVDGKVVVTSSGVKDRDLLRKELQERYNTLLAEREEAYAEMYNAMPDIINLMQDANRAVETLLRTGKVNLAAERTKRKEHEKELINDVLADLASPASTTKHHIDIRNKSIFERIATGIGSSIGAPLGSMDYMLRAIGRNAPLGEGRTYKRFAYAFQKAYDNFYTALETRKKMLDDKCNILWGKNYHDVHKMAESTKVMTLPYSSAINTKDGGWKSVENTTDIYVTQTMYILAMWNQAEGRVTLERQGFTDESINTMRDALNRIDPRWIEFADWVVEEYLPSGRERYNAVHRDIFGISMAAVPNYFPIKRVKEKLQKEEDVAKGDVDLLPSTVVGAIKERTSNVVPIDLETSFFEALNENTSVMESWAEMAGLIQDINTILSNGAVKTTMLDINSTLFSDFKKAAQVATLSYIGKTPDIDKKMGTILNRLWAGSKIAFRLNTSFKQVSSALLFAGYSTDPKFQAMLLWRYLGGVGKMPVALMNGIIEGASHLTGHSLTNIDIMTNIEWAKANLPSFAKRWNEGVAGNELMARTTSGNTSWKQRAWYVKFDDAVRAVTKFGMKPSAFIDAFTSAAGAHAVYDYTYEELRKEGYSEKDAHTLAIINAEMTVNTTQQSSEGLYLAPMQMDRSVVATTLSTFMNAPYAMFRNTMIGVKEIFRDAKKELAEIERLEFKRAMDVAKTQVEAQVAAAVARGEYSEEEAKKRRNELFDSAKAKIMPLVKDRAYNKYVKAQTKAVVMVFLNGYAGPTAFNLMSKLAEFMFGDDDEEKKKMLYDIAVKSAWEAPVSMMPLGGYVTSMVNGYSASFFPAMGELSKEISTIAKGLREEDISPEVIYAATTMCMRWGLGLSVDTIVNIALGIENMFEDGMSAEAILKVMNAPEGQIRNIVGQRKEGETAKEYNERVMRFYSILDTPIYEDYFYTHGEKVGKRRNEDTPRGMFEKQMRRLKYEEAYKRDVVLRYGGGKQLAEIEDTRKAYNKLKTDGYGNMGEYRRKRLQKLTSQINDKEFGLMRRVGSDAAYYEQLLLVDAYKKRYIELYEQFK